MLNKVICTHLWAHCCCLLDLNFDYAKIKPCVIRNKNNLPFYSSETTARKRTVNYEREA